RVRRQRRLSVHQTEGTAVKSTHSPLARRRFLATCAGFAALSRRGWSAPAEPSSLVIDCHAHIYSEDENAYPTIENPYRPPAGKGTVSHLLREMKANGVSRATAIQTSTFYRWDNRFLADSSKRHASVLAGVCTLDPDDPTSPAILERYARESNVRGMRSIPAKSGRLDDPGVIALWSTAERLGIVINVLVNRDKADEVESLARRHPSLRLVIDHCLNLRVGPELEPTLGALERLARRPNLHAKLTFIPTGTAEAYPCRDLHEPCRRVIAAFGPERCVWGSNFPCELWNPKVTYAQHLAIFQRELGLDDKARAAILGETARTLWFSRGE
ncbi:MAG: amidohydrolase, partial [Isosphaeraceae bacterium]